MDLVQDLRSKLLSLPRVPLERHTLYFKTAPGTYGAHDRFLGLTVPVLRQFARTCPSLTLNQIQVFLTSAYNEERLLALYWLIHIFEKGEEEMRLEVYDFYLTHKAHVNNWNLVDASAHKIVGAYLWQQKQWGLLKELALHESLWDRRIGVVASWYFIKKGDLAPTLELAQMLLADSEDLMHKAVGWMLREVGKQDTKVLQAFLYQHKTRMPRVMLRYAIERFSKEERMAYMKD